MKSEKCEELGISSVEKSMPTKEGTRSEAVTIEDYHHKWKLMQQLWETLLQQ